MAILGWFRAPSRTATISTATTWPTRTDVKEMIRMHAEYGFTDPALPQPELTIDDAIRDPLPYPWSFLRRSPLR